MLKRRTPKPPAFIYDACQLGLHACGGERAERRAPTARSVASEGVPRRWSFGRYFGDVITGGPHLFADECRRMVDTRQESCLHANEHSGPRQRASAPKRSTQTSPTARTSGHVPPSFRCSSPSRRWRFRARVDPASGTAAGDGRRSRRRSGVCGRSPRWRVWRRPCG